MNEKHDDKEVKKSHLIAQVLEDSPAKRAGIRSGDILLAIDGKPLKDIFDYHYLSDEAHLKVSVERKQRTMHFDIKKEIGEDLGLVFANGLLDDYRSCRNACVFCFIDQMPPGMRDTLYFKDDDTRLSFLQGNYVTLTNMSNEDLDRVIAYRMAPINVSVHATDPILRCKMLNNRFAGDVLEKMERIAKAKLTMNAQIVLCRGLNDGEALRKTIEDLYGLYPALQSLSVVPVGLTKFRKGLYPLESFDKKSAIKTLALIETLRQKYKALDGHPFVHASDEWYLLAGSRLPKEEEYDGYPQLENGVGMLRLLIEEFHDALIHTNRPIFMRKRQVSIATGLLAGKYIKKLCQIAQKKYPQLQTKVFPIRNDFFGPKITVSGLITGGDLMAQLRGKHLGQALLIPQNMLRAQEEVFLDDVTVREVEETLHIPVHIVKSEGKNLLDALLGRERGRK